MSKKKDPTIKTASKIRQEMLAHLERLRTTPILAASVQGFLKTLMPTNKLFHTKEYVYNRNTKERGQIMRAFEKDGIPTYEVWLPSSADSPRCGHIISHWAESDLEPSDVVKGIC